MKLNPELELFFNQARYVLGLNLRSKSAAVARLVDEIERYQDMGYTLAQLLEVLLLAGMEPTSIGTFQSMLARVRRSRLS